MTVVPWRELYDAMKMNAIEAATRAEFMQARAEQYNSALKDIAELAIENGPEWAQRRALRGLE